MVRIPPHYGLVVFSFAKLAPMSEPNPCNIRLAEAAIRAAEAIIAEGGEVTIVAQWEVAPALASKQANIALTVEETDGLYLGSEEVWAAAKEVFQRRDITTVVPVAHPFLQLHKVKRLIRADGFDVRREPIGWVGFESSKENTQWWTRGPLRLLAYALKQEFSVMARHDRRLSRSGLDHPVGDRQS